MIIDLLASLLLPAFVFLPILLVLIWVGTTHGLKPVTNISRDVDLRDISDLTPITQPDVPREIMPLIRAMNRLLNKVSRGLKQEREFTDNAAHELRTPLAAMKTQVQVLLKQGDLSEQNRERLENLLASINRGTLIVKELLSFARLQNQTDLFEMSESIDLSKTIQSTVDDLVLVAEEKKQKLASSINQSIVFYGNEQAMAVLVKNLIENAIKFTPEEGHISISLSESEKYIRLIVKDNGPGIPDEHKPMVFERFYRVNKSGVSGSGMGLAMVKWIADLYKAKILLKDNKPCGLKVLIFFPKLT